MKPIILTFFALLAGAPGFVMGSNCDTRMAKVAIANSANAGDISSVIPVNVIKSAPINLSLPKSMGVKFQAFMDTGQIQMASGGPMPTETLSAFFENVDAGQFEVLRKNFSGWSKTANQANFQALSDGKALIPRVPIEWLLPPPMQALANKVIGSPFLEATDGTFTTTITDCWSTAYEIIRHAEQDTPYYNFFFIPTADITPVLKDSSRNQIVKSMKLGSLIKMNLSEREKLLQPGDTIAVYMNEVMLQHEVTWLTGNLIFEKPSYTPYSAFRLNTLDRLVPDYGADARIEIHRWTSVAPLPPIMDQSLPNSTWVNDPKVGYYLKFPKSHGVDPYQVGAQRIEFFKLEYDNNGLAHLISTNTDR